MYLLRLVVIAELGLDSVLVKSIGHQQLGDFVLRGLEVLNQKWLPEFQPGCVDDLPGIGRIGDATVGRDLTNEPTVLSDDLENDVRSAGLDVHLNVLITAGSEKAFDGGANVLCPQRAFRLYR